MGRIQGWVIVVLLAGILTVIGLEHFRKPITKIEPAPQYEYKIDAAGDDAVVELMKTAGDEGWELVFARRAVKSGNTLHDYIETDVKVLGRDRKQVTSEMAQKISGAGLTYDDMNYEHPMYEMIFKRPKQ
jgi:predicted peroxiredoxin